VATALSARSPFAFSPGILAATVTSSGLIAQQVAGKAVRDALFLSSFKTTHLPHMMVAASVVSLGSVLLMPLVTARVSPRRLMPILFAGSGVMLVLAWLLYRIFIGPGAVAVYLHTSVVGPILITTFWSVINERFDPHTAKRAIAPITGGGTVGGVLGGLAAWRASSLMSVPSAILVLAAINFLCALGVLLIPTHRTPMEAALSQAPAAPTPTSPAAEKEAGATNPKDAFGLLRHVKFLRNLAFLVGLGAIISSLLDYVLGAQAVAHYGKGEGLLWFFSIFGLAISVLSLVLQMTLGRIAVEKIALGVHIAVLPGVVALGGAFGIAVPGLISAAILRGSEMVHRNTLFRSAYELLYTPVSEKQKRATKVVIDVGFDRAGTIIGSLITMVVIYAFAANQVIILGIVVAFALLTLPVVGHLHTGYVAALKERLLEGAAAGEIGTDEDDPTVTAPPASVDPTEERIREDLIDHTSKLKDIGLPSHVPKEALPHAVTAPKSTRPLQTLVAHPEEVLAHASDLLSNDKERVTSALHQIADQQSRPVVGFALALLANNELGGEAIVSLRRIAPSIVGQLLDLLLDSNVDFVARRRVPLILASSPTQRTVDGLVEALTDQRFEVRYAVGRALLRIKMRARNAVVLPRERIFEIVCRECAREEQFLSVSDDEVLLTDPDSTETMAPLDIVIRDRVSRGLEHIFTLLSMVVDGVAIRLCFRALHQDDARYRGAALEYLQTVLPPDVREAIWPLLGEASTPLPTPRAAADVLQDLSKAIRLTNGERHPRADGASPA
jgi:ATP:ADP antiporter, AAA family